MLDKIIKEIITLVGLLATLLLAIFEIENAYVKFSCVTFVILGCFYLLLTYFFNRVKLLTNDKSIDLTVKHIFKRAAKKGGLICSTSVRPAELFPGHDELASLLKQTEIDLEFKRVIVTDNTKDVYKWIDDTFEKLGNITNVSTVVYTPRWNVILPRFIWSAIPRFNIILRDSSKWSKEFYIGLDRVAIDGLAGKERMFGVWTNNQAAFSCIKWIFKRITDYRPEISGIVKHTERPKFLPTENARNSIFGCLSKLLHFSELRKEILHVGIFGRMASYLNGVYKFKIADFEDSDLDILIVVEPNTTATIIENILKQMADEVDIIFGHDDNHFYSFRSKVKITLHIQIHERDDDYYLNNKMLGISVFSNYYKVYPISGGEITRFLKIPSPILTRKERLLDLIYCPRKGVIDFIGKFETERITTDPRRVISIVFRNLAWALAGARFLEAKDALDLLNKYTINSELKSSIDGLVNYLSFNRLEIEKDHGSAMIKLNDFLRELRNDINTRIEKWASI